MARHNFKKLKIWNEGIAIVGESYKLTRIFPDNERLNFISQLNRCAVFIPSNIAEGSGKSLTDTLKSFGEQPGISFRMGDTINCRLQ